MVNIPVRKLSKTAQTLNYTIFFADKASPALGKIGQGIGVLDRDVRGLGDLFGQLGGTIAGSVNKMYGNVERLNKNLGGSRRELAATFSEAIRKAPIATAVHAEAIEDMVMALEHAGLRNRDVMADIAGTYAMVGARTGASAQDLAQFALQAHQYLNMSKEEFVNFSAGVHASLKGTRVSFGEMMSYMSDVAGGVANITTDLTDKQREVVLRSMGNVKLLFAEANIPAEASQMSGAILEALQQGSEGMARLAAATNMGVGDIWSAVKGGRIEDIIQRMSGRFRDVGKTGEGAQLRIMQFARSLGFSGEMAGALAQRGEELERVMGKVRGSSVAAAGGVHYWAEETARQENWMVRWKNEMSGLTATVIPGLDMSVRDLGFSIKDTGLSMASALGPLALGVVQFQMYRKQLQATIALQESLNVALGIETPVAAAKASRGLAGTLGVMGKWTLGVTAAAAGGWAFGRAIDQYFGISKGFYERGIARTDADYRAEFDHLKGIKEQRILQGEKFTPQPSEGLKTYMNEKNLSFAEGGIVKRPVVAAIGEAGYHEAVIPMSNEGVKPLATMLAGALNQQGVINVLHEILFELQAQRRRNPLVSKIGNWGV